jgi:hypothetical protein
MLCLLGSRFRGEQIHVLGSLTCTIHILWVSFILYVSFTLWVPYTLCILVISVFHLLSIFYSLSIFHSHTLSLPHIHAPASDKNTVRAGIDVASI